MLGYYQKSLLTVKLKLKMMKLTNINTQVANHTFKVSKTSACTLSKRRLEYGKKVSGLTCNVPLRNVRTTQSTAMIANNNCTQHKT